MVSTRTENRRRRLDLLIEADQLILKMLVLEHRHREQINLSEFKRIANNLKEMLNKMLAIETPRS